MRRSADQYTGSAPEQIAARRRNFDALSVPGRRKL